MNRHVLSGRRPRAAAAALALTFLAAGCADPGNDTDTTTATTTTSAVAALDQADLQTALEAGAKEFLLPGAVALLRTPSGTVTATYGSTERGGGRPVSVSDRIRVGSNTKTWTATVILQQAQEGKLAVTDPVSRFRPDVPNGANITIEQLLNMRSGLFNYSETAELNEALDTEPQRVWTPEELLALAYPHPPYFPPGQGYHYSNTNYVLLGLIAEQLDGRSLPEIYRDRIFDPAGLTGAVFPAATDTALPAPYSRGYFYGSNVLTMHDPALPADMQAAARDGSLAPQDVTEHNPSWTWAAGQGVATADDLATWAEALTDGTVLDPDMQARRLASIEPTDPANPQAAGYGWGIAKMGPMYGHTGELPGYNSFMGSDPDRDVTLVVWANLAPGVDGRDPASSIAKDLIEQMYPK
ncbi:serine hydrolase domain-containing protein [Rhodococcus sp. NPDC058532]|uniref:serine hydrolase domain-containing protein n=1 Tax=Rhodococcus sp. NPDC058532 TaxID=3346540 RepID=UPI0036693DAD